VAGLNCPEADTLSDHGRDSASITTTLHLRAGWREICMISSDHLSR
jgi:hypothetical protein